MVCPFPLSLHGACPDIVAGFRFCIVVCGCCFVFGCCCRVLFAVAPLVWRMRGICCHATGNLALFCMFVACLASGNRRLLWGGGNCLRMRQVRSLGEFGGNSGGLLFVGAYVVLFCMDPL